MLHRLLYDASYVQKKVASMSLESTFRYATDNGTFTITHKLKIIMWNIGMAQKAKETRSGCLVHIVQ